MSLQTPDALIAPWLAQRQPKRLWVIGPDLPPIVADFCQHRETVVELIDPATALDGGVSLPDAALCSKPLIQVQDLELIGGLRNRLIGDIFCLVAEGVPKEMLYGLGFVQGQACQVQGQPVLSFHYSLATYNHTRAWNNPKFWANPENWNKYWW